jgi:glycosyltransferase involved in cell wall biosynthesis
MSYAVIIPSYNRPEMLQRALGSIYQQTLLPSEIQLVVDETEDAEKYRFLKDYDERLKVTFTGGGLGGADARNIGLDQVTADYVFFLDDDDEWLPEKVEKQMALLEERPDCIGVTCGRTVIDEQKSTTEEVTVDERRLNRLMMTRNITGSFSFFGYRRNLQTQSIRLEDGLPMAQDLEFYMALSEFGSIGVVHEPLANYYAHTGARITGSDERALRAYSRIQDKYRKRFSFREACWYRGLVRVYRASEAKSLVPYFGLCFTSAFWTLLSVQSLKYSLHVLRKGINKTKLLALLSDN